MRRVIALLFVVSLVAVASASAQHPRTFKGVGPVSAHAQ